MYGGVPCSEHIIWYNILLWKQTNSLIARTIIILSHFYRTDDWIYIYICIRYENWKIIKLIIWTYRLKTIFAWAYVHTIHTCMYMEHIQLFCVWYLICSIYKVQAEANEIAKMMCFSDWVSLTSLWNTLAPREASIPMSSLAISRFETHPIVV